MRVFRKFLPICPVIGIVKTDQMWYSMITDRLSVIEKGRQYHAYR